jgi:hypothetical protein
MAISYDQRVPKFRESLWLVVPVLLLLALYWPGLTSWFQQDDFGWLNVRHDVHSASDLAAALFAPKAHGNMRPLGENAYWLFLSALFGMNALPFHLVAFLTQAGSLLLLAGVVRRLTGSRRAGTSAAVLWAVNSGLAYALGWCSIYNQVLSGFFLLLAFWFLLRWIESGGGQFGISHWVAFLLGLGALEINVVYPAQAVMYAALFAPAFVKRILPMFGVSAAVVALHFHVAPLPEAGVYAPRIDGMMGNTLRTYWDWGLGSMALPLSIIAMVGIGWSLWRREFLPVLGLGWFVIPLLPYLPLPQHKMPYYLAVPSIGIAMLGAFAVKKTPVLAGLALLLYIVPNLQASWTAIRWQHDRSEKIEDLVRGVAEIHQAAPDKIIVLDGIDNFVFWGGVADLPFRAAGIPRVYLAPGSGSSIQAPPGLLAKYILPASLARGALVYRFDGQMLHAETSREWDDAVPRFVNLGDPVFAPLLGAGWGQAKDGARRMDRSATFRIAGQEWIGESLYLGVFETRPFTWSVKINGAEARVELVRRDNDVSEFRAVLPGELVGAKSIEIRVDCDLPGGLQFGYAEVR